MKLVIQRVTQAEVEVDKQIVGKIKQGFLVFVGVAQDDTKEKADYLIKKLCNLRVFCDNKGKMNLDLKDIQGELLIVSQFTLYADCKKGNRPSFTLAGAPELANSLYQYVIEECQKLGFKVEHGIFGANMKVSLVNDGPVTILLEN